MDVKLQDNKTSYMYIVCCHNKETIIQFVFQSLRTKITFKVINKKKLFVTEQIHLNWLPKNIFYQKSLALQQENNLPIYIIENLLLY